MAGFWQETRAAFRDGRAGRPWAAMDADRAMQAAYAAAKGRVERVAPARAPKQTNNHGAKSQKGFWAQTRAAFAEGQKYGEAKDKARRHERAAARTAQWHFSRGEVTQARYHHAEARRFHHEWLTLRSGRSFWETNDLDAWARRAHFLKSELGARMDFVILMAEVPGKAIRPLRQRIAELERLAA